MAIDFIQYRAVAVKQNRNTLYLFSAPAKILDTVLEINQRESNKDIGYQRTLSASRVRSISDFVHKKNEIPSAIVVSLRDATFDHRSGELSIPRRPNSGWVIDGQHRLAGATNSDVDIELAVVAFLDLELDRQIFQFVTINKTAKGVPTSLYYDLLRHLPPSKTPVEKAREKSADIAHQLTRDDESPLFNRITVSSPRPGQSLSLNNFVRKVAPLIQDDPARSPISTFNVTEQTKIIDNYFRGLSECDPQLFRFSPTVVFRTLGFGALLNALSTIFGLTLKHHKGFRVEDIASVFSQIDFDFSAWESAGSGNAAEIQAGKYLEEAARYAYPTDSEISVIKRRISDKVVDRTRK